MDLRTPPLARLSGLLLQRLKTRGRFLLSNRPEFGDRSEITFSRLRLAGFPVVDRLARDADEETELFRAEAEARAVRCEAFCAEARLLASRRFSRRLSLLLQPS